MIFVPTARIGQELQSSLRNSGLDVQFYHSKLGTEWERRELMKRFQGGSNRVLPASAQSRSRLVVGDKRLSDKVVERLEHMHLVEESFIGGEPRLQLTIIGQAIQAQLL